MTRDGTAAAAASVFYSGARAELEWVRAAADAAQHALCARSGVIAGILDLRSLERPEARSFVALEATPGHVAVAPAVAFDADDGEALMRDVAQGKLSVVSPELSADFQRELEAFAGCEAGHELVGVVALNAEHVGCLLLALRAPGAGSLSDEELGCLARLASAVRDKLPTGREVR